MKKVKLVAAALLLSSAAGAQTIYEAAGLIDSDLNGTARYVGMGGAMNALGGDVSVMRSNPAGIGQRSRLFFRDKHCIDIARDGQ